VPLNSDVRFVMRLPPTVIVAGLISGALAPVQAQTNVTVQIFADGTCQVADSKMACEEVGAILLSMHVPVGSVIALKGDVAVSYKPVAAAGASLKNAGYRSKIAYITTDGG
jgi:biopolymer transport protein ExbD